MRLHFNELKESFPFLFYFILICAAVFYLKLEWVRFLSLWGVVISLVGDLRCINIKWRSWDNLVMIQFYQYMFCNFLLWLLLSSLINYEPHWCFTSLFCECYSFSVLFLELSIKITKISRKTTSYQIWNLCWKFVKTMVELFITMTYFDSYFCAGCATTNNDTIYPIRWKLRARLLILSF